MKKFKKYTTEGTGSSFLVNTGQFVLYFGIVSGVILIILSIDQDTTLTITLISIGIATIVNSIIFKAFITVIASINDNLEELKNLTKIEKGKEKSLEIEENKPFDPHTD
jgi:DNA integrity scanning protein DisA with diadenylate cyclase activity